MRARDGSIERMDTDVIVVGGGPSGSTAAREIASRGARVLLLDRAKFPRDKPCGGGVTVRCAALLPFSLDPIIEDVVSAARLSIGDGREIVRTTKAPLTFMTQRRRLDAFLVERAQEAGVEFRDGQAVTGAARRADGIYEVTVGGEVHRARVLIGADGANGVVGNRLGYDAIPDGAVALEGNIRFPQGVPPRFRGQVTLNFGEMPGGYGWVFAKGDHVNVGVGGWRHVVGERLRPALRDLCLRYGLDPDSVEGLRGHHLPMQRPGMTIAAMGSAVIGDAAGLVDPLSGEGIYAALASGIAVAPAVRAYLDGAAPSLEGYQTTLRRELLDEVAASAALMDIFHTAPGPFVWLMQHSGRFWDGACRLIRGETSYEALTYTLGPAMHAMLGPTASLGRMVTAKRLAREAAK